MNTVKMILRRTVAVVVGLAELGIACVCPLYVPLMLISDTDPLCVTLWQWTDEE